MNEQDKGASDKSDRATAAEPVVSALRDGIPSAGDRVRLVPDDCWKQPMRGWAERERLATVKRVFSPLGSKRTVAVVRFDRTRAKGAAGEYLFAPKDLIIVERAQVDGNPKGENAEGG